MKHFKQIAQGTLDKARAVCTTLRRSLSHLWRAHLERLATSPVYETVLLALIELVLGHRLDLQQLLVRLMAKLRRTPPEIPDGWAY